MNIIIAGGRDFNDYELLKLNCDSMLRKLTDITIVSGAAKGADSLGERYANEKGYKLIRKPADWDTHGKSAGYRRNEEMAEISQGLIAFWDGKSKGTGHMINIAKDKGLQIKIVRY